MSQLGFYGAIENQTNTIQNSLRPSWFDTSVHELSHMWFGDMITCKSWHHGWLNEGFATYSEGLWLEYTEGFEEYKIYMDGIEFYGGGTLYLENVSDPFGVFISIIYNKGAWFLHMLRGVVGDEVFFDILYQYSNDSRFRYDHADTEDFQEVCETVSGMDLNFFFNQWIYDEYYPKYNYGYYTVQADSSTHFGIEQIQSLQGWRSVFKMPVQVQFKFTDGSDTLITVWNDQINQEYQFHFSKDILTIVFDPDNWILKQKTYITDVSDNFDANLPIKFSLSQNYPNPFNPYTIIKYSVASKENLRSTTLVQLKVYDILGNEIAVLVNDEKQAGNFQVEFDASQMPSGIYFYRLNAGSFTQTKKMILLK